MLKIIAISVLVAAGLGSAGVAQAGENSEYAYMAIARADYARAEAQLLALKAVEPKEPSVLINLAHVYQKTGRALAAASMYQSALSLPDVMLEMPDGRPASSHMLARSGLSALQPMARAQ